MGVDRITRAEFAEFQTAVDRWQRKLSADERDDLVQEAAHAFCEEFPERGICRNPVRWLIRSAKILALEHSRKRLRRWRCEPSMDPERLTQLSSRPSTTDLSLMAVVEAALKELPEHESWAAQNCYMFDKSVAEAARERGVNRSTMFRWRDHASSRLQEDPILRSIAGVTPHEGG